MTLLYKSEVHYTAGLDGLKWASFPCARHPSSEPRLASLSVRSFVTGTASIEQHLPSRTPKPPACGVFPLVRGTLSTLLSPHQQPGGEKAWDDTRDISRNKLSWFLTRSWFYFVTLSSGAWSSQTNQTDAITQISDTAQWEIALGLGGHKSEHNEKYFEKLLCC